MRPDVPEPVPLVVVRLPSGPAIAAAITRFWGEGWAVAPVDPALPPPAAGRLLRELRPERIVDGDGDRALPGGAGVPDGVAVVLPTSGTSGPPKGVQLTHANLKAAATASASRLGTDSVDRWLCCLPLHHVAGVVILARAALAGHEPVVHETFDPAAVAAEREATLVSLVPTMLRRLLDAGVDLGRFRRILLGGAPASPAVLRRAAAAGARVVVTYGSTETCGGVVYDGVPLDGVGVRVDAGPEGDPGPIWLSGPTIMAGYRGRPDLSAAALVDGWFRTADVGRLDAAGRLDVAGRADDVILTGGRKVAPAEVEAVLARHPGVADVAVAGVPDPEWGEAATAFVVPTAGPPPTLESLRSLVRARLAPHNAPLRLVLLDALPRSATGKLLRRSLARLAPGGDEPAS